VAGGDEQTTPVNSKGQREYSAFKTEQQAHLYTVFAARSSFDGMALLLLVLLTPPPTARRTTHTPFFSFFFFLLLLARASLSILPCLILDWQ
jgi:hypothetical protein